MARMLSGRELAKILYAEIKGESDLLKISGTIPTLGIIRVGNKEDDMAYEKGIIKNCEKAGIKSCVIELEENVTFEDFVKSLNTLNNDALVHGILIFRPLPKQLNENDIKHLIDPAKDIDCMNPLNLVKVFEGDSSGFAPCTPQAVMEMLKNYEIDLAGKKIVVIGRSMVVGKPLSMMLLKENATVTICHSKTVNLPEMAKEADVLVAAIGKPNFVNEKFIRPGAVVIDVGINIDAEGKLCGDVDSVPVSNVASYITPVPGGVGSVTTAVLLKHVVKAANSF